MLSNLTAEQRNILQTLLPGLGYLADTMRAVVTMYLPGSDKRWLNVYVQKQGLTLKTEQPDFTGRKIRSVEEPLVCRTLQKNIVVKGRRELEPGKFCGFVAYPVRDVRGKCFAAISIQADEAELQKLNGEPEDLRKSLELRKLLDKAKSILMSAHGMTEQEAYRKMQQYSMAKRITLKQLAESIIAAAGK